MPKQTITPGPWAINGNSIVTEHPANIGICKMYGNIGQPVAANAQAIAAVPEMIEALKLMGQAAESIMAELGGKGVADWGLINKAFMARTAALRKAGQID